MADEDHQDDTHESAPAHGPDDTAARAPADVTVQLRGRSSEWSFEWTGLLPVALILVVAVAGWRWLGDGGSASGEADAERTVVTTTTEVDRVSTTVATTVVTTTSAAATTTTTAAPEPTVDITGEMKPCRFGANCLVASFTIEGFDDPPERFTCIYPNSRRDFTFRDGGKDDACITADEGDTIAIEVGGVTSATISEADLDG